MEVFLHQENTMKKTLIFAGAMALLFVGVQKLNAQKKDVVKPSKIKEGKTLYFNPEVFPDIEEIKEPTNQAFFSMVSDKIKDSDSKMIRVDAPVEFDSIDSSTIEEYCRNNGADFAIVPKVKYFKVGLGKYVFSNQVVVSMKLFDSKGTLITEAGYDTYRKNMRLLGSAENSVKKGTDGVMKRILKNLRRLRLEEADF
ncbi:MAG: pyruvate decarboxylase [Bergeyella sp.]